MGKTGRENQRYTTEFKICVIMDIREHRLSYQEAVLRYWNTKTHFEKCNYSNVVKRWECIFLEEGAEGLIKKYDAFGLTI